MEPIPHPKYCNQIVQHTAILQEFIHLYNSQKLHHAYIFKGIKGIGKATLAHLIAKIILSTPLNQNNNLYNSNYIINPEDANIKLIHSGTHPGLLVVEPDIDEAGNPKNIITVDKVRVIKDFLNLTSLNNYPLKIIIIDSIDNFNINASNAILKMLEEPPSKCLFLLINHNSKNILPTINSRCIIKKIPALNKENIITIMRLTNVLNYFTEEEINELVSISEGSLEHILWFINPTHKKVFGLCKNIINSKNIEKIPEASEVVKSFNFNDFQHLTNLILYKINNQEKKLVNESYLTSFSYSFNKTLLQSKTFNLDQSSILINLLLRIIN